MAKVPGAGNLWRIALDGSSTLLLSGLEIPNGMAWNEREGKGTIFYHIDSSAQEIRSYSFEPAQALEELDIAFSFKGTTPPVYPDGMAIAPNGLLYVALFNGGKVVAIDPIQKEIVSEVLVDTPQVTSLAFIGPDLFITTGAENYSKADFASHPIAGSLFKATLNLN